MILTSCANSASSSPCCPQYVGEMSADSQKAYGGLAGVKEALASLGRAGIVTAAKG